MGDPDFDQLRAAYKQAVDEWVDTIRAEEAWATPDHSMIAWEQWDAAHFREQDAHKESRGSARDVHKRPARRKHRHLAQASPQRNQCSS